MLCLIYRIVKQTTSVVYPELQQFPFQLKAAPGINRKDSCKEVQWHLQNQTTKNAWKKTFCSISSPSTCFLKSVLKSRLCKSSLKYLIISFCIACTLIRFHVKGIPSICFNKVKIYLSFI